MRRDKARGKINVINGRAAINFAPAVIARLERLPKRASLLEVLLRSEGKIGAQKRGRDSPKPSDKLIRARRNICLNLRAVATPSNSSSLMISVGAPKKLCLCAGSSMI